MAHHVRVHREGYPRAHACPRDHLSYRVGSQRATALGNEYILGTRIIALSSTERANLGAMDGMRSYSALASGHVEQARGQIHLVPT